MPDTTPTSPGWIFISYRRDETAYPAGWLYDRLAGRFGAGKIFKDIDSIELGDDFVEVITTAVGSCDVLLALIGREWLTITGEDGQRRLDDRADFVRVEIEAALTRDVRVIPVLVGGASMPRAEALPASLRKLVRLQALELSPSRFDLDTGRLLRALDRTLTEVQAKVAATARFPPASTAPDEALAQTSTVFGPLKDHPSTPPSTPAPPEHTGGAPTPSVPHRAQSSGRRRTPGKQLGRLSTRTRIVAVGAALVVLLLLILAAVVITNDSDRQAYVDAFASKADESIAAGDVQCVAESLVDGFGVDTLVETGVTPDDIRDSGDASLHDLGVEFSEEQNRDSYERLRQCMNFRAFLAALLWGLVGGSPAEEEAIACVGRNLTDDLLERTLVPTLTRDAAAFADDLQADLEDVVDRCTGGDSPGDESVPTESVPTVPPTTTETTVPSTDPTVVVEGVPDTLAP